MNLNGAHMAERIGRASPSNASMPHPKSDPNGKPVEYVDYDDPDEVQDGTPHADGSGKLLSHLCGRTTTFGRATALARDLLLSCLLATFLAILSALVDSSCKSRDDSYSSRCMLFSSPAGAWLRLVAFALVVSAPARIADKMVFAAIGLATAASDSDTINTAMFFLTSFEGSISRFGSLGMVWTYGAAVFGESGDGPAWERTLQVMTIAVSLGVLRNLLVRTVLRNVLVSSFEGKIQDTLFANAVVLAVSAHHAVDPAAGTIVKSKDADSGRLQRMYASSHLRLKLDFIAKLRFRMYNRSGELQPVPRREMIASLAKAAFRRLAAFPSTSWVEVDLRGRGEEISIIPVGGGGGEGVGRGSSARQAAQVTPTPTPDDTPAPPHVPATLPRTSSVTLADDSISRMMTSVRGRARAGTSMAADALRAVTLFTQASPSSQASGTGSGLGAGVPPVLTLSSPRVGGQAQGQLLTAAGTAMSQRKLTAAIFLPPDPQSVGSNSLSPPRPPQLSVRDPFAATGGVHTSGARLGGEDRDGPGLHISVDRVRQGGGPGPGAPKPYTPWPEGAEGEEGGPVKRRNSLPYASNTGSITWLDQLSSRGGSHAQKPPGAPHTHSHAHSIGATMGRRVGAALRQMLREGLEHYESEEAAEAGAGVAGTGAPGSGPGSSSHPGSGPNGQAGEETSTKASAPPARPQTVRVGALAACIDPVELDVDKAVALFSETGAGDVSRETFTAACESAWAELRALKASLNGQQSVVTALSNIIDAAVMSLLAFAALLIFDVDLQQVFVPLGTILVSASFAIGTAISNSVNSLIFVLRSPYHVGDRITASGVLNEEMLTVRKIDLMTTTFLRPTNREITVPNFRLLDMNIENLKRSPPATLKLVLAVHAGTAASQLEGVRRRINAYLDAAPASWKPGCTIRAVGVRDQTLDLMMFVNSRFAWQDVPRLYKAHFALWMHVLEAMRQEGVAFRGPDAGIRVDGQLTVGLAQGSAGLPQPLTVQLAQAPGGFNA